MTDTNPNTPDPGDGGDDKDNTPNPAPEPVNPNTPVPGDGNTAPVPGPDGTDGNAHTDGEAK